MARLKTYRKSTWAQQYSFLVDDADYEWLSQYRWKGVKQKQRKAGNVYIFTDFFDDELKPSATRRNGVLYLHRLIMQPPYGFQVDHINHNTLDYRRLNLRIVTPSENSLNNASRFSDRRKVSPNAKTARYTVKFNGVTLGKLHELV